MIIKVTAEHIASGLPNDCGECPIARAVNAVLKPGFFSDVDGSHVEIYKTDGEQVQVMDLPRIAERFIEVFDESDKEGVPPLAYDPFEFELPIKLDFLK